MAGSTVVYILVYFLFSSIKVCLSSETDLEGRIVNGENAKIGNYPHAVFLNIIRSDKSTHICGSSIVNQHFLLTAAHCFSFTEKRKKDKIVAYAGHEDLNKTNIVRKTHSPIVHKKFDLDLVLNDIALVYVPNELPLGKYVKRIIIKRSFPRTVKGALAGWGVINEITNEETMLLKSVVQTIKNKKECSSIVNGPGMLCAGSMRSSDPRPAKGDSGSGLITNKYQLIGVLSFKDLSYPALPVYTNVTYYYSWIKYHTRGTYCSNL